MLILLFLVKKSWTFCNWLYCLWLTGSNVMAQNQNTQKNCNNIVSLYRVYLPLD